MNKILKVFLISLTLLFPGCANISTSSEPVNIKVMNKELRKAAIAFRNEDINTALKITKKYAEMGNAKAQYLYGKYIYMKFYFENYGKVMDHSLRRKEANANQETLGWMAKSAEQGYARAQYSLAMIYSEEGKGVTVDRVRGLMWTILAASQDKRTTVEDEINQAVRNYDLTSQDVKQAKRMAKEWRIKK